MDVFELIKSRRSIRQYNNIPIEKDKLVRILEAMRLAPSAVNLQEWKFFIITNTEIISNIWHSEQRVPALIIATGEGNGIMTCGHERSTVDLTIAMTMGILQAQELGLGTCIVAGFHEEEVRKQLGLSEEWRVPLISLLGYPAETPEPRPRKPFQEVCCIL